MKPEGVTKFNANQCRRRNLQTLVNNTSVIPFKWRGKYLCYFCGIDIENYLDLKEHMKTHIPCSTTERAMKLVNCGYEIKIDVSETNCNVCSEQFPTIDDLISHLKLKHKLWYHEDVSLTLVTYRLADLKCLVCTERFKMFCNLIRHMNRSHPDDCFQCDICSQKYSKKRDLSNHVRTYHKKDYNCPKCSLKFSCFQELLKHKMKEHLSRCNLCLQTFSSYQKRLSHMKKEHELDDGGECGFCNKRYHTKLSFLDHATKCKVSPPKEVVPSIVVDDEDKGQNLKEIRTSVAYIINMTTAMPFKFFHNKFKCFYCAKDFTSCNDLRQHTTTEHPICETSFRAMKLRGRSDGVKIKIDISSLYCKICFERFNDFVAAVDHLEIEHKAVITKCISVFQAFNLVHDKFGCPFCDVEFRYFSLLLQHVNASHSGSDFVCTFCGKTFPSYPNLRGHLSHFHSSGRFKCSNCNLGFSTTSSLKEHMGKTHGSKVINCQQCPEKFISQYRMMRHTMKVHDGGHKCSYCGMAFIKYSFMINHIRRLHLNEKNVLCTLCNQRFFDANRLKMHMVRHVGERSFRCDYCGKRFLRKKNLRGHVALHLKNGSNLISQL